MSGFSFGGIVGYQVDASTTADQQDKEAHRARVIKILRAERRDLRFNKRVQLKSCEQLDNLR